MDCVAFSSVAFVFRVRLGSDVVSAGLGPDERVRFGRAAKRQRRLEPIDNRAAIELTSSAGCNENKLRISAFLFHSMSLPRDGSFGKYKQTSAGSNR